MNAYAYEGWLFWIMFYLWIALEIMFGMRARLLKRGQPKNEKNDRGSVILIVLGMYFLVAVSIILSMNRLGVVPDWMRYAGYALMIVGMVIRFSAIYQLGRFFSPVVSTVSDQEIVQTGFYRLIRHPAYTGGWITAVGIGLGLQTWLGTLVCGIGMLLAYIYRIHIEERVMIDHFGENYLSYMKATKRMFPGIW
ncbi:isoprenylcysteine carboxylmethyltransferase family protein [Alicyclobacillus cycloheptanicus]|uniref:Protein-S-isoprenylcysteine O-methyltransferase Ste14 n=1 Tax=Alicyclobacillus cycloheptanicus TaxID=1457 RepID=A0ABT9XM22_9BACL|nr:isoprenylcysteine carboxylmethyltransferase family protein [Alicyclobacillus cycloheptanicus]MDQ0191369.1 protein-S-isoprenylcysteine O-methyltransferase Ste14 [Alicyclobacillus cycloheptanicus]WDM02362.1 isoprenylcysteine carboxylmethyltransferase family protein [Alicyclobacillus cycloheptanicus]